MVVDERGNLRKYAYGKRMSSWAKSRKNSRVLGDKIIVEGPLLNVTSNYMPQYCIVCGQTEKLSLHHIVPECYVGHELSYPLNENLCILCVDCHSSYDNNHSPPIKEFFREQFNVGNKAIGMLIAMENCQKDFFIFWLEHFLKAMKPKYLPIRWDHL